MRASHRCDTQFKDLSIGDTFDFVDDANPMLNSFYATCTKVSLRSYTWERQVGESTVTLKSRVGSWSAKVYHVNGSAS